MKTHLNYPTVKFVSILIIISVFISCSNHTELEKKLSKIENSSDLKKLESDSIYTETYELWFTQNVDHDNPESEKFKQRVIVNHVGFDRPTVVILEGYNIYSTQAGELSKLLNANQITIEHRFFDDSKPDSIPWEHLTINNAAIDQHKIIESLKSIYTGKWVSTGISKGGQTTMYHRRFFPNDVDASVVYVAPLNLEREDARIAKHLNSVSTKENRHKVLNFQTLLFEKKEQIMPLLKSYAQEKEYSFVNYGIDRVYDLNTLEYSFAFWQWNGNLDAIPNQNSSVEDIFDHWQSTAPFSFFYDQDSSNELVFTYQALSEIGFYSYDIEPFRKYLKDTSTITFDFKIPKNINYTYHPESMQDINNWIQKNGNYMLYIYGENDPWASTAVNPSENTVAVKMINPNGNHRTRIESFPKDMKENIYKLLEDWLDVKIERKNQVSGSPGVMFEIL